MSNSVMIVAQIILVAGFGVGLIIALGVAIVSRYRKAAPGEFHLLGARAAVETRLEPEGAVLIRGELWRARTRSSEMVECGRTVRVTGTSDYLLEVEPISN